MSDQHLPGCPVRWGGDTCTMDCYLAPAEAFRPLSTHLGDGEGEALLNGGKMGHHEREDVIARLVAHHENSFAQLAMDQARLLRDELPDRVTMEALNRMMGRHAAILAELRR